MRTKGGIGASPATARSATCTGVPSSTIRLNSPMNRPKRRLVMKDALSLTRMVVFFRPLPVAKAVAKVASSVFSPGMISSRGMTATGLKKWKPTTRSGCSNPLAICVIDRDEVFVASTHSDETTASTSAKTCCLTAISSKTASMTKSASAKPSLDVDPVTSPLRKLALSWPIRPLASNPSTSPWT